MAKWTRWQDWANVVLGVILIISPWVLGATGTNAILWGAVIGGVLIALVGLWALYQPEQTLPEWVNLVLGIWVVVSPWVLGYSGTTNAVWYDVIVGVLVAAVALWTERFVAATGPSHA